MATSSILTDLCASIRPNSNEGTTNYTNGTNEEETGEETTDCTDCTAGEEEEQL